MKRTAWLKHFMIAASVCLAALLSAESVRADELIGIWTKETLADPQNLAIIYREGKVIKVIGYGDIGGTRAVWFATGEFEGFPLRLRYHYSDAAVPPGWSQDGVMILDMSGDGETLTGTATSDEGDWSGPVMFRRVR